MVHQFGYAPADVTGKSFLDFIHTDDVPEISRRFAEIRKGAINPFEFRLADKTGKYRQVREFKPPGLFRDLFSGSGAS